MKSATHHQGNGQNGNGKASNGVKVHTKNPDITNLFNSLRAQGSMSIPARHDYQVPALQSLYRGNKPDNEYEPLTVITGAAGTGKTYMAMAMYLKKLIKGEVKKIVLTRPAVTAGEDIGFLPGDLDSKLDPYMQPFFDILGELNLSRTDVKKMIDEGLIEIGSIGHLRGRTLTKCAIICDEAQNATMGQLELVLTRMGEDSLMCFTGDPLQCDLQLKTGENVPFQDFVQRLEENNIGNVHAFPMDAPTCRHEIVGRYLTAKKNDLYAAPTAPRESLAL